MEDLYKNDPNSWLWRTNFSQTVYHRPDVSHVPISFIPKPKLGSSNPKPNDETAISIPVDQNHTFKPNNTGTAYKDDPNSRLRRSYSGQSQNADQAAISIPFAQDNTPKTNQVTSGPDGTFNGVVHGKSDSKTNNNDTTSKHWVISDMHKKVAEAVRKWFRAPASRERTGAKTVKSSESSSIPKKERRRLQKYFCREVSQVSALEKSSEVR